METNKKNKKKKEEFNWFYAQYDAAHPKQISYYYSAKEFNELKKSLEEIINKTKK